MAKLDWGSRKVIDGVLELVSGGEKVKRAEC